MTPPTSRGSILLPLALSALVAASRLHAAGVWDAGGGANTNWDTAANWDNDAVPSPGADVTFGTGGATVGLNGDRTAGALLINRAATFTIQGAGTLSITSGLTASAPGTYTYTVNVPIAGTGTLSVTGSGTTFTPGSTANTFTGLVSISQGEILVADGNDGRWGDAGNALLLTSNGQVRLPNQTWNPGSGRVLHFGEGGGRLQTHGGGFTFDNADQVRGPGLLRARTGDYGTTLTFSQPQPSFSGGIDTYNNTRRQCDIVGTVSNSLGSGPVTGSGQLRIGVPWGAQATGGAADGGRAGITVRNGAAVNLSGGTLTSDRFIIDRFGALRGSSTLLPSVSRVASFTAHGGTAAPEAILAAGAVVSHTSVSTVSITGGGTGADLLFGLGANFNSAGLSLDIGAGTPWAGLSKDCREDVHTRLQTGTVVIHDGGGSFTQLVIRTAGHPYSGAHNYLYLGSGADCPLFTATASRVSCRIQGTWHNGYDTGEVWLDSTAPQYSGGIERWIVGGDAIAGRLISRRTEGFDGIALEIDHRGEAQQYNGTSTIPELAFRGAAILSLDQNGVDTAITAGSLTQQAASVLMVTPLDGSASLGDPTSPFEKLLVTGYPTGHVVSNAIFATDTSLDYPELLDYSAADGFAISAYDETANINSATDGDFAKFTSTQTITADRSLAALVAACDIACQGGGTGTYTLRLGRLAGGQAAFAPLLASRGSLAHNIRPNVDFGTAEGIVYFRYGSSWSSDLNLYGSLQGTGGASFWGGQDLNRWIYLRGTANSLQGPITVLQGYVEVISGNGFAMTNDVKVMKGGLLSLLVNQTYGAVSGLGTLQIGNGITLSIADELVGGTSVDPLSITGSGTLRILASGRLAVDLDVLSMQKTAPRVNMGTTALTLDPGARISIRSMANLDALPPAFDVTFAILQHNGTVSGTFSGVELPAGFNASREILYDATGVSVRLTSIRGTVFVIR